MPSLLDDLHASHISPNVTPTYQYRRPSRGIVIRRGLIARLLLRARDL